MCCSTSHIEHSEVGNYIITGCKLPLTSHQAHNDLLLASTDLRFACYVPDLYAEKLELSLLLE